MSPASAAGDEGPEQFVLLLARRPIPSHRLSDPGPGAAADLAAIRFRLVDDARDPRIVEVEDVAEQEDGPLDRIEPLERCQQRQAQLLRLGHHHGRIELRDQRLGQPGPDVLDPPALRQVQAVDREPRDYRRQERGRRAHLRAVRLVPARKRLLHHVLGLSSNA
jgi:hypothetical protein